MQRPARRRHLRRDATDAELLLWRALRARQIGAKFRRQHAIGPFVVDLYCVAARLAIEVDGGQHYDPDHVAYDQRRTRELESAGVMVMRFTNRDVLTDTRAVLEEIFRVVEQRGG